MSQDLLSPYICVSLVLCVYPLCIHGIFKIYNKMVNYLHFENSPQFLFFVNITFLWFLKHEWIEKTYLIKIRSLKNSNKNILL